MEKSSQTKLKCIWSLFRGYIMIASCSFDLILIQGAPYNHLHFHRHDFQTLAIINIMKIKIKYAKLSI